MTVRGSYTFPIIIILLSAYLMGNIFYREVILEEPANPDWLPSIFVDASIKWGNQHIYDMVGQIYLVQLIFIGILILDLERIR